MKTVLTIAGSDSSGGAGIQADLKTMLANGVYGMSVITALTAQNTVGVTAISEVNPEFLMQQLDAVFTDIPPDAIKIGMVPNEDSIAAIQNRLTYYQAKNIVVDPVMVATSGASLCAQEAIHAMQELLFPLASVITPNIPEGEVLSGMKISGKSDMISAAQFMGDKYGCSVLLKGGHSINDANDLLYADGQTFWFHSQRIENPNTHGTGCTLSSAIASGLAKGDSIQEAIRKAKAYIVRVLSAGLNLGKGSGPLHHGADLHSSFIQ